MPFQITNKGDYFFSWFFGVITPEELDRFADEAEAAEDSVPASIDRITDLSAVERFDVGYAAINALAKRRRQRRFTKTVKSAIITRDATQLGIARMFQTLNDHPQIDIRLWYNLEE